MATARTMTLGAVGDVAFWGETDKRVQAHGPQWPFEKMLPHLRRAELLFGNMESVVIPPEYPKDQLDSKGLISTLPGPLCAEALKRAGFHFLNLAANHVLDAGSVGMDYTQQCLNEAGLITGGVGKTQKEARKLVVVERNGITFGFLCYCEDTNYTLGMIGPGHAYYALETVLEDVERHKKSVDVLVVSIHADIEFMPTPSVPRLNNSRQIARAGAKLILEHHPHVPQGVEMIGKSLIAYSLGNFVFNAHTSDYMKGHGPHTSHSFLLLAQVSKRGVEGFERVPFQIQEPPEQRPHPLEGKPRDERLAYFAQLDGLLNDEAFVQKTWRDVARRHLEIYITRAAERIKTHGIDIVIEELIPRLCFTAENRSCMDEILKMAHEAWEKDRRAHDPLHRPHWNALQRVDAAKKKE